MRTRGGRALTLFEWRAGFHSQNRNGARESRRVCAAGQSSWRGHALEGSEAVQPGSEPFCFVLMNKQ